MESCSVHILPQGGSSCPASADCVQVGMRALCCQIFRFFKISLKLDFPEEFIINLTQKCKTQHELNTTCPWTDSGCRPPVGAFGSRLPARTGHLRGKSAKPEQSHPLLLGKRADSPCGPQRTRAKQAPRGGPQESLTHSNI